MRFLSKIVFLLLTLSGLLFFPVEDFRTFASGSGTLITNHTNAFIEEFNYIETDEAFALTIKNTGTGSILLEGEIHVMPYQSEKIEARLLVPHDKKKIEIAPEESKKIYIRWDKLKTFHPTALRKYEAKFYYGKEMSAEKSNAQKILLPYKLEGGSPKEERENNLFIPTSIIVACTALIFGAGVVRFIRKK